MCVQDCKLFIMFVQEKSDEPSLKMSILFVSEELKTFCLSVMVESRKKILKMRRKSREKRMGDDV